MKTILTAMLISLSTISIADDTTEPEKMSSTVNVFAMLVSEATGGAFHPEWHEYNPLEQNIMLFDQHSFSSVRTIIREIASSFDDVYQLEGWIYYDEPQGYKSRFMVGSYGVDIYYFPAFNVITIAQLIPLEES